MSEQIEKLIADQRIERLVHFTRLENLESVLERGLIPRAVIRGSVTEAVVNDALRLDGRPGWNCLSITFPNSRMFYAYQKKDETKEWCVLLVSPRVLVEKEVLFCKHNAADARISKLPEAELRGAKAMACMFDEIAGHPTRIDQRLKDPDPTDVQAEVLVRGLIEPDYFDGVVFRTSDALKRHHWAAGKLKTYVSDQRGFFGDRGYYRKWGQGK